MTCNPIQDLSLTPNLITLPDVQETEAGFIWLCRWVPKESWDLKSKRCSEDTLLHGKKLWGKHRHLGFIKNTVRSHCLFPLTVLCSLSRIHGLPRVIPPPSGHTASQTRVGEWGCGAEFMTSTGHSVLLPHGPGNWIPGKKTSTKPRRTVHICKQSSLPKVWSVVSFCFVCFRGWLFSCFCFWGVCFFAAYISTMIDKIKQMK